MKHKGTLRIETDRLILRRFVVEDVSKAYKNWTNDLETVRYLTWPAHGSLEVTEKVIKEIWIDNYNDESFYQWAIELKEIGEPIGSIGAVLIDEDVEMVEIGYCIGSGWYKGIMPEALSAVIQYFFEMIEVNRIQAKHDVENVNSGKVMKKCGMVYEGILRKSSRNNTGIVDTAVFSILKDEYKKQSL